MNETEIVLNLLDFYKRKGLDLHKILDDPHFKSLSRDSQLIAIKTYADRILAGTPQGITKQDIKKVFREGGKFGLMGGLAGALTAYGASKAYQGGVVPPAAYVNGAVIGAIGGFAGKLFETYQKTQNRKFIGAELQRTINNPTDRNAFGVLVANGVKGDEEFKNKILEKIQGRIEGKLETQMDDATGGFTERYNEHVLKKPKFV